MAIKRFLIEGNICGDRVRLARAMHKPPLTQEELARLLDVNKRTIIRNLKVLIDGKYVERIGANKNGYWKINYKNY